MPKKNKVKNIIEEDFVIDTIHETEVVKPVTIIIGEGHNVHAWVKLTDADGDVALGHVDKVSFKVYGVANGIEIGEATKKKWMPKFELSLGLGGVDLNTSVGHLLGLIDILKDNADEESDFLEFTTEWWKLINMDLKLDAGAFGLGMQVLAKPTNKEKASEDGKERG